MFRERSRSLACWLFVAIIIVPSVVGTARVLIVQHKGGDYDNLGDAVRAAVPGDVIVVNGWVDYIGSSEVVIDKDLIIKGGTGDPTLMPIVKGTTFVAPQPLIRVVAGYVVFQDLTIQPPFVEGMSAPGFSRTVLRVEGSANVTLSNVKIWGQPYDTDGSVEVRGSSSLTIDQSLVFAGRSSGYSIYVSGSPSVHLRNSAIRTFLGTAVHIEGEAPQVIVDNCTIQGFFPDVREGFETPSKFVEVAVRVQDVGSGGSVTVQNCRGRVQRSQDGYLEIIGAIGGQIAILRCSGSVLIENNEIIGQRAMYGGGGISIYRSPDVTIRNNFVGFFGQKRGAFDLVYGVFVEDAASNVTISGNEISSNGSYGVMVNNRGAVVQGQGNSIYLNCVSSYCQKESEFKTPCRGNVAPCDYLWPAGFLR